MRVTRALRAWGYPGAGTFSTWSCVANPINATPRHVLPIGFVQSPLLASLVLMKSDVSSAIESAIANGVVVSVYLDDFIGSHNDMETLTHAYTDVREACLAAGLLPNPSKLVPPSVAITAFNCDLTHGSALVRADRVSKYMASPDRTGLSDAAFEQYRDLVACKNTF